jgi:hypothetical protein
MNTVREHWDAVISARQELIAKYGEFGTVYLMSLRRRKLGVVEGRISVAGVQVAAMMLAQETHREADEQEIADWKAEQAGKSKAILAEKAKTDSKVNINLGDNVMELLARAALAQQQPTAAVPVAEPSEQLPRPATTPPVKTFD